MSPGSVNNGSQLQMLIVQSRLFAALHSGNIKLSLDKGCVWSVAHTTCSVGGLSAAASLCLTKTFFYGLLNYANSVLINIIRMGFCFLRGSLFLVASFPCSHARLNLVF